MHTKLPDTESINITLAGARQTLLDARTSDGIWQGRLSSSPLATAVAVFALHSVNTDAHRDMIHKGLSWLESHQHPEGGWGDAETLDPPNLSSTLLCYAAMRVVGRERFKTSLEKAEKWLVQKAGGLEPDKLAEAVYRAYGDDRTFAVPILTMCTLAGILGKNGWQMIEPLPFELAMLPRFIFRWLKLTVVSYALPALIAIGQVKFHFNQPGNLFIRAIRRLAQPPTLDLLGRLQPANGGFLEATPLTSFVVMSLAAMGLNNHAVTQKGVAFICGSMRDDGSWPIDTNLSTWVTSLAVNALLENDPAALTEDHRQKIADWYVAQQFTAKHIYTAATPGGWGWTNLPGAVPDADDTAGALVALHRLGIRSESVLSAVRRGIEWLLDLQNSDGGIPTFCRGWGKLEFDRSCPDLTAHAIMAVQLWKDIFEPKFQKRISRAIGQAVIYLYSEQRPDGSWLPLWFGCSWGRSHTNPVYGTAKVILGLVELESKYFLYKGMIEKAAKFLIQAQNKKDGGWGAQKGIVSSVEETALAINALIKMELEPPHEFVIEQGHNWLKIHTRQGTQFPAASIGLYFARLWYAEQLYPTIFAAAIPDKHLSI